MNILEFALGNTRLAVMLSTLLLVLLGYAAGRVLQLILRIFSDKITKKTRSSLDDLLVETVGRFITAIITISVAYMSVKASIVAFGDTEPLLRRGLIVLVEVLYVVAVIFACHFLASLIDAVVRWYLHDVATRTQTHLDDELAPLANRVLKVLIYAVGTVIILDHFEQNISTLVVSLGVGTLAIALAAQETLANMIAGFVLMIDRPFRIGDRIRLPDGSVGVVKEIGIRSTKVIDDSQVMIISPNAEIVKSQIRNFSYPNDIVRFEVPFGVAYGTDLEAMRAIVLERVNREADIVEPENSEVRITAMGDSSMDAKLLCRIRNPNNIPRRTSDLLLLIYNTLYEHRIEIPFPQRVLHLAPDAREVLASRHPSNEE
jgi:MscS family membrane protein